MLPIADPCCEPSGDDSWLAEYRFGFELFRGFAAPLALTPGTLPTRDCSYTQRRSDALHLLQPVLSPEHLVWIIIRQLRVDNKSSSDGPDLPLLRYTHCTLFVASRACLSGYPPFCEPQGTVGAIHALPGFRHNPHPTEKCGIDGSVEEYMRSLPLDLRIERKILCNILILRSFNSN